MKCYGNGCDREATERGLCHKHYYRFMKYGSPDITSRIPTKEAIGCKVEGCTGEYHAIGYCKKHFQRYNRTGLVNTKRKENGNGHTDKRGYIEHCINGKRCYEHRLVVEKEIGKELSEGSVVHHIDGNKLNNNLNNLMIFKNKGEHARHHHEERRKNKIKSGNEALIERER